MLTGMNSSTVVEGDIANFFVKGLELALAPKMCPGQSQTFKEVNNRVRH